MKVAMPVVFKYLALPNGLAGRGGAQRFFLERDLVDMAHWGAEEKNRIVQSGENPCGSLPLIYMPLDDHQHQQGPASPAQQSFDIHIQRFKVDPIRVRQKRPPTGRTARPKDANHPARRSRACPNPRGKWA